MVKKLNANKAAITVVALNIIQIISIIGYIVWVFSKTSFFNEKSLVEHTVFLVIAVTALVIGIMSVKDSYFLAKYESQNNAIINNIEQVENLNKTLRAQRHDFMNHLQVVYSLMEMDEYKEAKDYIEKVYNDIQKVSRVLKTSIPAVNALLQAKIVACESRNIMAELNVSSPLNKLPIPQWELCRILSNLIDNSMFKLGGLPQERILGVDISEDIMFYIFKVWDNGPSISQDIIGKIFDAGFTTKGEKGEGMGLAISKEITMNYGGNIKVESNDKSTCFTVTVPKH